MPVDFQPEMPNWSGIPFIVFNIILNSQKMSTLFIFFRETLSFSVEQLSITDCQEKENEKLDKHLQICKN